MAVLLNALLAFCVHASYVSPTASSQTHMIRGKENATLTCSIPVNSTDAVIWFHQRAVDLTAVLKVEISTRTGDLMYTQTMGDRFDLRWDRLSSVISLVVTDVRESDLGTYHCIMQQNKMVHLGTSVKLAFLGEESGCPDLCWVLAAGMGAASAVLCALCTYFLRHLQGKTRTREQKGGDVHYASLKVLRPKKEFCSEGPIIPFR
ncbi:uncharacterized protein LOC114770636 [Denticeps clupeoides]|uniref:uncharacterized protein LOC114770636 n=1 Tax=Denticeps clupeoides TaxID=299321 RepID=UPI0010A39A22|nr:uncharacterized protein LOC114770636 [Denticeps clupeoides]